MMKITQMPTTVTLKKETKEYKHRGEVPFDLSDLPTDFPIQVFGYITYYNEEGANEPCWLLLGYTGIHPVAMSLVGKPMSWDEEIV